MNRSELYKKVAEQTGLDRATVAQVCDCLFDTVIDTMKRDEHVTITGFGRFEMRSRRPRSFTNPKTGASMTLESSSAPGFTPSNAMKKRVRER